MYLTLFDFISLIKFIILIVLCTQFAYGLTIVFFEKTMLGYYDITIFRPAATSFQKITNGFQKLFFGIGYYVYTKIGKYNWFVRKILYIVILLVQGILSIILYYLIAWPLDLIAPPE